MKRFALALVIPFTISTSSSTHNKVLLSNGKEIINCDMGGEIASSASYCNKIVELSMAVAINSYEQGKRDMLKEVEKVLKK